MCAMESTCGFVSSDDDDMRVFLRVETGTDGGEEGVHGGGREAVGIVVGRDSFSCCC